MYYDKKDIEKILKKVKTIVASKKNRDEKLQEICDLLEKSIVYYDWIGFYIADEEKEELNLGPFIGDPTEHNRIAYGQGICGQAAVTKKPFVVQDVRKETNYLSCSVKVMSEIVVPILKGKVFIGELDIDSHTVSPFTDRDILLLEDTCAVVATLF
jgi:L-methionine (R)-S-oxide reductase